jgi:hypothetical protein
VLTKIIAILLLIAMIVSLFMGMYYLVKDQGKTNRTLKALTWRISIWVVLFALLALGAYTGFLEPSVSIKPDWAKQAETGQ